MFAVGGDPAVPLGPYEDSLALIESGVFWQYGVRHISIAGTPTATRGSPATCCGRRSRASRRRWRSCRCLASVLTQVEFDVDRVLSWLAEVRQHGVELPVRVGVPGPTSIKGLLGFASRLGVSTSATIARKYGFSVTNLLGKAGPDKFIREPRGGPRPG